MTRYEFTIDRRVPYCRDHVKFFLECRNAARAEELADHLAYAVFTHRYRFLTSFNGNINAVFTLLDALDNESSPNPAVSNARRSMKKWCLVENMSPYTVPKQWAMDATTILGQRVPIFREED